MAPLVKGRRTDQMLPGRRSYPMKAGEVIFAGGIVMIDSSGRALAGDAATGCLGVGRATTRGGLDRYDNTSGSDGDIHVEVEEGTFKYGNSSSVDAFAAGDEGKPGFIVDDQTGAKTSAVGTRSPLGRVARVDTDGVYFEMGLAVARQVAESLKGPIVTVPVVLVKHTGNGTIAARFTPGFAGRITKITAAVTDPASTANKAATFTPAVAGTPTTGGAVALTTANCTPVGAKVNGSAITAGGEFGETDEITVVSSGVTAFGEGQVVLHLHLDRAA